MYEIGDIVLHGVLVGVVVSGDEKTVSCNCSDGVFHRFATKNVTPIASYKTMLESFRGGIMANVDG